LERLGDLGARKHVDLLTVGREFAEQLEVTTEQHDLLARPFDEAESVGPIAFGPGRFATAGVPLEVVVLDENMPEVDQALLVAKVVVAGHGATGHEIVGVDGFVRSFVFAAVRGFDSRLLARFRLVSGLRVIR
jgi:hypothetical protein